MENIMANMFDNDTADGFFDPSRFQPGNDWTGWFTSDAASDEGRNNQDSTDLINALFSDPDLQKDNLFDPFTFDSSMLDPALFDSGLNQDSLITGLNEKVNDSTAKEQ